jgi:tetratricopeptide (TPR) repeat protein
MSQATSSADLRQIALLLADATILAAWLHFDLERHYQALALYRECGEVADQLGDTDLLGFVIGRQARTMSESGRHEEALKVAESAREIAQPSAIPALTSWLAITRAYIHACLGEEYACLADIASAHASLSRPATAEVPPYLAFYGESYLAKWEGHTLLRLGCVRRDAVAGGRKAIDTALASWAPDDIRESGEVLAACAAARLAQAEIPEAARLTAQAWQVAVGASSPRILRYVTQLRRDLAPWRDVDAVRELDDLIFGAG